MKISVITVCLNSAKTIERAMKSVIGQAYPDLEYIVIDGGSTDGTIDIIKKQEPYISYWASEPDDGIYDAMNKGIAKATGEIVAFLNSDDWYEAFALEKAADYFRRYRPMVLTGKINTLQAGKWKTYKGSFDETEENIRIGMTYRHPATFVRRELFERFGCFDTQYKIAADYEWMLRIYDSGIKSMRVDTVFTNFCAQGISSTETEQTIREAREIALSGLERCGRFSVREKDEWKKRIYDFYDSQQAVLDSKKWIRENRVANDKELKKRMSAYLTKKAYTVWGTGSIGDEVYCLLTQMGIEVKAFVDSKADMGHSLFHGIPVRKPEALKRWDNIIVASVEYEEEITGQLESMGYRENENFILYSRIREYMIMVFQKAGKGKEEK